jgi:hypothetical protein
MRGAWLSAFNVETGKRNGWVPSLWRLNGSLMISQVSEGLTFAWEYAVICTSF